MSDPSDFEDFGALLFAESAPNAAAGSKRKRKSISMETKLEIITAAAECDNKCELERRFGIKRTSIITILDEKEKILQAIHDGAGPQRKRLKLARNPALEDTILKWVRQARSQNIPISGHLIKVLFFKN